MRITAYSPATALATHIGQSSTSAEICSCSANFHIICQLLLGMPGPRARAKPQYTLEMCTCMHVRIYTRYTIHITYWIQYAWYPLKGPCSEGNLPESMTPGCVAAPPCCMRRCRSSAWPVYTGIPPAMPPPCQVETINQTCMFHSEVSSKPQRLTDPFYSQQRYLFKTEPACH